MSEIALDHLTYLAFIILKSIEHCDMHIVYTCNFNYTFIQYLYIQYTHIAIWTCFHMQHTCNNHWSLHIQIFKNSCYTHTKNLFVNIFCKFMVKKFKIPISISFACFNNLTKQINWWMLNNINLMNYQFMFNGRQDFEQF